MKEFIDEKFVKLTLMKIGIDCDLVGFDYLAYAIQLVIQNPKLKHNLCKGLYSMVSEKFNADSASCVERSIRHAILKTYNEKSFQNINILFEEDVFDCISKPTSGQLINILAQYFSLGLYRKHLSKFFEIDKVEDEKKDKEMKDAENMHNEKNC